MVFSKRYKDLVFDSDGQWNDRIVGELDFKLRKSIINIMIEFDEPKKYKRGRYTNDTFEIGAFYGAIHCLNNDIGYEVISSNTYDFLGYDTNRDIFAGTFAPFLFDIIEYQYELLSSKEKKAFSSQLNEVFSNYDSPWILHDGNMVKIDSCQFEMDLKNKAEALLKKLKDAEPEFQPAYDELNKAIEFYNKFEYSEAVQTACKSYESVLKVCLNVAKGNADKLTSDICEKVDLPTAINVNAFKDKVLMSLPFIRNNAASHGAGAKEIVVSKELANLSINLACSLITYIIDEYKKGV